MLRVHACVPKILDNPIKQGKEEKNCYCLSSVNLRVLESDSEYD